MSVTSGGCHYLSTAAVDAAIAAFSRADWQRAKAIASYLSAGLSEWSAEDLLQEAMTALLDGTRSWPAGSHPLVVLKVVMRSIASNARKRDENGPIDRNVVVAASEADLVHVNVVAPGQLTVTPEDALSGKEQIVAIYAALAGDADLQKLVEAWADGVRGAKARTKLGWNVTQYDAVRKRLVRRLETLDPGRRQS